MKYKIELNITESLITLDALRNYELLTTNETNKRIANNVFDRIRKLAVTAIKEYEEVNDD